MITGVPEVGRGTEMTSGQGENSPGGPYGPPQGWNPPPGPQYPGYAPAPSAPAGYGTPRSMERPMTGRAGPGACIGLMVLSVVSQVVTLLNYQTILNWTFDNAGIAPGADRDAALQAADVGVKLGIVVGFVFVAVYGLF